MAKESDRSPGIVLPVIHLQNEQQAVAMAEMALEEGAGGVFVIDHKSETLEDPEFLAEAATEITRQFPELWVGVNCLGYSALRSLEYFGSTGIAVDGIWTDNALDWQGHWKLHDHQRDLDVKTYQVREATNASNAVHFGGLSMKGRGYIPADLYAAEFIKKSQGAVDIVTTSGTATGQPMSIHRLIIIRREMRKDLPLAIASGVDANNVKRFLEFGMVQHILVGSSIETHPLSGVFDREKLKRLMSAVLEFELSAA